MKMIYSFFSLSILFFLSSCQTTCNSPSEEVVCGTIHRYGMPLEPEDWSSRGQNGQIISMRTDGVTVTRSYDAGILHGDCCYSYPYRDTVQKKEVYNQGVLQQEFSYYPSGSPCDVVTHELPNKQHRTSWFESGAPQSRERCEDSILISGEYYNLDQQIDSRVENGNGVKICRNNSGMLEYADNIENGQTVLRTHYHDNGNPSMLTPYVNNSVHGERKTYLPGGEPGTIETWQNGIKHGNTTVFEYGQKRALVPYVDGKIHGVEQRYRDDESLVHEVHWVKGNKHGPCYTYVGDSCQTEWYFRDKKVANKATFDMLCNQ